MHAALCPQVGPCLTHTSAKALQEPDIGVQVFRSLLTAGLNHFGQYRGLRPSDYIRARRILEEWAPLLIDSTGVQILCSPRLDTSTSDVDDIGDEPAVEDQDAEEVSAEVESEDADAPAVEDQAAENQGAEAPAVVVLEISDDDVGVSESRGEFPPPAPLLPPPAPPPQFPPPAPLLPRPPQFPPPAPLLPMPPQPVVQHIQHIYLVVNQQQPSDASSSRRSRSRSRARRSRSRSRARQSRSRSRAPRQRLTGWCKQCRKNKSECYKLGDWECPWCGRHKYAPKRMCTNPECPSRDSGSSEGGETWCKSCRTWRSICLKEGDWACSLCDNHNYASKEVSL